MNLAVTELNRPGSAAELSGEFFRAPIPSNITYHPEKLLLPADGTNPIASMRTVHAATLFSGGAVIDGELNPKIMKDFQRARLQGVTALYVIGMWESTPFSQLWIEHWAPISWKGYDALKPWVGASTFSTDAYFPNQMIGSWENLDIVLDGARKAGIEIVPCFVTNTIGVGGALMRQAIRENPDTIMSRWVDSRELDYLRSHIEHSLPRKSYHREQPTGSSQGSHSLSLYDAAGRDLYRYQYHGLNGEHTECLLQMSGGLYKHVWVIDRPPGGTNEQIHTLQLGSEDPFDKNLGGNVNIWADTIHRSVHLHNTRRQQMVELGVALERFDIFRCDMAHLAGPEAWRDYTRITRDRGTPTHRMILEAYLEMEGTLIEQDHAIAPYAKFLYKWLVEEDMNVAAIMRHVHDDRSIYQQHRVVAYVENHDDKGTVDLPKKGAQALIITSLPVESVLWSQNQRTGDDFRISATLHMSRADFIARQRAILMGEHSADPTITRDEAFEHRHLNYLRFFRRVEKISALPVFRSKESEWSRALFTNYDHPEHDRIFNIVRTLNTPHGTDRALVMVDARRSAAGTPVTIDIAGSFNVPREQLWSHAIVNLITGSIQQATPELMVSPEKGSPEPHSYAYALVRKDKIESFLTPLNGIGSAGTKITN